MMLSFLLWTAAVPVGSVLSDTSQVSNIMSSAMIPDLAKEMVQASLLGLQGTPEARSAINTILELLESLLTSVEQKHNATQEHTDEVVDELGGLSTQVTFSIGNATVHDTQYVNCSSLEKQAKDWMDYYLDNYTNWCVPNVEYACKHARMPIKSQIDQSTFSCNHREKNCEANFKTFNHSIDKKRKNVTSNVRREVDNWKAKWENCTKWSNRTRDTYANYVHWRGRHTKLVEECTEDRHVTVTGVCDVKTKAEDFCDKFDEYGVLVNDTKRKGTIFSHPDRQQEWFAIKHAECILEQVLLNATINHTKCDASYDFLLDYHKTSVDNYLAIWNCSSQTTVKLNGTEVVRDCQVALDCDISFEEDYVWNVTNAAGKDVCGSHCTIFTSSQKWHSQANLNDTDEWSFEKDGEYELIFLHLFEQNSIHDGGTSEVVLKCSGTCVFQTTTSGQGWVNWNSFISGSYNTSLPSSSRMILDSHDIPSWELDETWKNARFEPGQNLTFVFQNVQEVQGRLAFNCERLPH